MLLIQVHRNRVGFEDVKAFLSLIGEMAMRLQLPLATNDRALVLAAADTNVSLLKIPGVTLPFS